MKKLVLLIDIFVVVFFNISLAQDFWQPTNGPFGGAQVNDFLQYEDSTIFLATSEGLIKSTDNGNSWNRIPEIIKYFYSINKDSVHNLYATAIDEGSNPYLYKSINGGIDWVKINDNFWANFRNVMIYYKDTIIVGSWDHGLYRTFDGGLNWTQINNGLDYLHIYQTVLLSNGDLLVGTSGSGVYRSSDWGDNWTDSNTGIPLGGNNYRYVHSILEVDPGKILCGTQNGIYYSTNYGLNWIYRSIGVGNKHANDLTINKNHYLFAGTDLNGVFMSTNEGANWNYIGLNYSIYTLGWDADSNLCAGGLGYGLNRFSFEDSTWTQIYNQAYTATESDIICNTENENVFTGTWWWGLYHSRNKGQSWDRTGFTGIVENIASINDSTLVINGVHLTRDYGNTWQQISNYDVSASFYDSTRQILYIGTYGSGNGPEIYSSTDLGQNWEFISYVGYSCWASWINSIFVSRFTNYLFANTACYDPRTGTSFRFYRSTDGGQSWDLKYSERIFDITENSAGDLYALSSYKLLISHDSGTVWSTRNIEASCLAIDIMDRIYYGYAGTVKSSDKEALNWVIVGNQLTTGINDMTICQNEHTYLATDNGVYLGDLNNFVVPTKEEPKFITAYMLSQNYPNPFNPSTTINYQLPKSGFVTLKVYDVLGREVTTLVNEEKPAGTYELTWNAVNLPSGVYFYQLHTGSFIYTKKMILLK